MNNQTTLVTFNCVQKNLLFVNTETTKVSNLNFEQQINIIKQLNDNTIILGTAVNGKLLYINNLQEIQQQLQKENTQKINIQVKDLYFDQQKSINQLELKTPIEQQTIWTTPFLHWQNIWYLTCLSCDIDSQMILTVWSDGYIFLHDSQLNFIACKHITDITCGCWISNGLIAFGTKGGLVQIVQLQVLLSQTQIIKNNQYLQYNNLSIKHSKQTQQQQLEAYLFDQQQKLFDSSQIEQQLQISKGKQIVTLKSNRKILSLTTQEGQFFVYNLNLNTFLFQQPQNHQQTILSLKNHPTISDTFITVSGDSTAKVYKNFQFQASFGTTQIMTIIKNELKDEEDSFGGFISVEWDPRDKSAICAIGTITGSLIIADVYRNKIYKVFQLTKGRIFNLCWQNSTIIAVTEEGQIYLIDTDQMTQKVISQLDVQLRGCDVSKHDKLLGCTGYDGYCRIFVYKDNQYQQVGKFAVTQEPLYGIQFHPTLTQTLALSSDDGSVKIYRYENTNNNFKVQCVQTLKTNSYKARVIQFNELLPNIIAIGKWCGEIDIFDWVQGKLLYTFQAEQDIYGLEFNKLYPLQLLASGRDINIRKLYLAELAEKSMLQTVLASLDSACCQLHIQSKGQYFKQQDQIKQIFLSQLKTLIRRPSYSYMKNNPNIQILSEQCMSNIIDQAQDLSLQQILSQLIDKFSYENSGYKQLLDYSSYWINKFNDITDPYQKYSEDIDQDDQFYNEEPLSNGICLTPRSLLYAGRQLGRHYYNAIFGSTKQSQIDPKFNQQRYKFFEFQRELPQDKQEAFQIQTKTAIMLLACSGDFANAKLALKQEESEIASWFGSSDQQFNQNQQDKLNLSEIEIKILKAVGYLSQTDDKQLVNNIIDEIQQHYPNMLTYALMLQNLCQLDKNVEKSIALFNLKSQNIIKSAMFYLIQQDYNQFEKVLELYGNSTLSTLVFLNCNLCQDQFDKLALISAKYHIKFEGLQGLSQNKHYWLLNNYMSQYTQKFKEMRKNGVQENSQFNVQLINQQLQTLTQYNLNKFENWLIQCQQPDNFTYILSQMSGDQIQLQYKQAVNYIIHIVNYYVENCIQQNRELQNLNKLYMQFQIRNLNQNDKDIIQGHILNSLIVIKQNIRKQLYKLCLLQLQNLQKYINKKGADNLPESINLELINQMQQDLINQQKTEQIGLDNQQFIEFVNNLDISSILNFGIFI